MLSGIIQIDTSFFFFFNRSIANPVFDVIMPFITNFNNWRIPIVIIWLFIMIRGGKKGRVAGVLLAFVLIGTDQLSSSLLKPLVGRVRPCHVLEHVRLLVGCGGKLAFPSSHATNMAGVAILFSFFYRKGTPYFVIIALAVGFSRIYVGVHYPLDVLGGFTLGTVTGAVIIYIYLKLSEYLPAIDYRSGQGHNSYPLQKESERKTNQ